MIRTLAKVVATVVAAPLILVGVSSESLAHTQRIERGQVIHEDDPRWDCRTMGNHTCGVMIEGQWYLVKFTHRGYPMRAVPR
jgi:hypothetical protein